ncbi:MAG TPA: hypothetical protein DIW27_04230, partial [Cytophagales bacterium]|nr:hypothetical protein [Cytophagales bacterium]
MANSVYPKKILLVEDHPATRMGLISFITSEWPESKIHEFDRGDKAVKHYSEIEPDLVLTDYQMPGMNGLEFSRQILRIDKNAKIILFTFYDTFPIAANFLHAGGRGFVAKDGNVEIIVEAINSVLSGHYYFHSNHEIELTKILNEGLSKNIPALNFTTRELQVALKISKGLTTRDIAGLLGISPRTVETHRQNLLEKTNAKNTAELIEYIL